MGGVSSFCCLLRHIARKTSVGSIFKDQKPLHEVWSALYERKRAVESRLPGRWPLPAVGVSAASWPTLGVDEHAQELPPPAPRLTASRTPAGVVAEAELIEACLRGLREAQKQLYDRYAPRMMVVCLRYAQTSFEAEDVLQEGFVTVFRTLLGFRRECPLEFWIRRIMINAALRQHRRNAPLVAVSDGEYPAALASEEFTLSSYAYAELLQVVQQLAPRYRMVFNLYAIEGYTHKEIGELLTISEGTSKSQYSRARAILQTKLERLGTTYSSGKLTSPAIQTPLPDEDSGAD